MMQRVRRLILMGSIWMICAVSIHVGYGEVSRGVVTLDSEQSLTVRFSNQFGIRMSPLSVNKTLHFSEVFYTNAYGVKLRSHPISTDWIGPMMVRTADGSDAAPRFTGGFHGSDGDEGGNPTSKNVATVITVDGVVLGAGDVKKRYAFNEMTVQLVYHIDAYNSDAGAAVEETVIYVILPDGRINVHVKLTALSDIVIERYYGLQSRTFKSTKIIRMSGIEHKASSYFESVDATAWEMDVFDRYWVAVSLEPIGLGDFSYCVDKPHAFNLSYGKTYFNLVNNTDCPVSKGSSVEWSGSYVFNGPVNEGNAVQNAVMKETKVTVPVGVVERYIECGNIVSY